jgi:hypothetical protein
MYMKFNYINTKNILLLLIGLVSVTIIVALAIAVSVVRSQVQMESMADVETVEEVGTQKEGGDAQIILKKREAFLNYKNTLPPLNSETQRAEFIERTPDEDSEDVLEKRKAFLGEN